MLQPVTLPEALILPAAEVAAPEPGSLCAGSKVLVRLRNRRLYESAEVRQQGAS